MAREQSYFLPTSIDMGSNATKADRLRRKPDTFRRLTGITPEDFDQVMEDLRPLYEEASTRKPKKSGSAAPTVSARLEEGAISSSPWRTAC
jgi:hypothetical protein